jgi:hypothetical protein
MVKMLQAKKLQYEAMKEIMPPGLTDRFEKLENELLDIGKEFFMAAMSEAEESKPSQTSEKEENNRTKKVTIE